MSKNIFDVTNDVNNNIQRHSFDWSHHNSFTAKLGKLYPLFSSLVPANFKFDCDANLGLQFMPMKFPVQTPIKARMSFFKVPLRTLWNDYQDFVSNFRDDLEEPYHDINDANFNKFYGECQLGDFLDIPNVIYRGSSANPEYIIDEGTLSTKLANFGIVNEDGTYSLTNVKVGSRVAYAINEESVTNSDNFALQGAFAFQRDNALNFIVGKKYTLDLSSLCDKFSFETPSNFASGTQQFDCKIILAHYENSKNIVKQVLDYSLDGSAIFKGSFFADGAGTKGYQNIVWNDNFEFIAETSSVTTIYVLFSYRTSSFSNSSLSQLVTLDGSAIKLYYNRSRTTLQPIMENTIGEFEYITPETSPYYSSDSNAEGIRLSCYRARAYEAIYNAYYRDVRNNPFYVDGKLTYNKWLPNYDGGADKYPYQLRSANWEKDFLTTAVPSPQQGKSPLVGLTQYISEEPNINDDENTPLLSYKMALVDEDGKKYSVKFTSEDETGYALVQVGEEVDNNFNVLPLNPQSMIQAASGDFGISIPDLRLVNAYQKFLELNMRKGYSYKDIVEGRFDCKVRFDELMMPEFIGGFTRDIQMNRVVQSVDANYLMGDAPSTYAGSLGSLSGDAFLSTNGQTPHIHTFCDEESIIIGILSVVPVPAYSQLLPKDYLYRDLLDHFNPEFNHLGFQPIKYAEICPLQLSEFNIKPEDTFGYQRPWYEYVSKTDTVHGLMRTNLRNFIMNRNFVNPPLLSQSFLLVDENQVNDVFTTTEETDKIIGQCYFDIKVESPVSRVAIPRLD